MLLRSAGPLAVQGPYLLHSLTAALEGIPRRPPANPAGELGALQLPSAAPLGARGAGRLRGDPAPRRRRGRGQEPTACPSSAGCGPSRPRLFSYSVFSTSLAGAESEQWAAAAANGLGACLLPVLRCWSRAPYLQAVEKPFPGNSASCHLSPEDSRTSRVHLLNVDMGRACFYFKRSNYPFSGSWQAFSCIPRACKLTLVVGAKRNFDRSFCSPHLRLKEFELFPLSTGSHCWRELIPSDDG